MLLTLLFVNPLAFLLIFAGLTIAVTIHEFAHAWVADRLGDPTARLLGRVTLNPLAHMDPLGTLLLLVVGFGWGRPVPFDPFNLENPRRDSALIALAGPASNVLLVALLTPLYHAWGLFFLEYIIQINVVLALFNLIPIYPLDGFKIVGGFIPEDQADEWHSLERYGIYLLLFVMLPFFGGRSLISHFILPILDNVMNILLR